MRALPRFLHSESAAVTDPQYPLWVGLLGVGLVLFLALFRAKINALFEALFKFKPG